MKIPRILTPAALAASLFLSLPAFGESKVEAEKPKFDDLPSPEFSGGKNKSFKPNDWLEVETKIKISLSPEPKSKTADEVVVKWYVAVKNPDVSGNYIKLEKSITHINVPLDEEFYSSVYLSPGTIRRLTGTAKGGKNAVYLVGFEVLVGGEVKAAESDSGKAGWWKVASAKISNGSDNMPLLSKPETPFANMWWDRYAEVKLEK